MDRQREPGFKVFRLFAGKIFLFVCLFGYREEILIVYQYGIFKNYIKSTFQKMLVSTSRVEDCHSRLHGLSEHSRTKSYSHVNFYMLDLLLF